MEGAGPVHKLRIRIRILEVQKLTDFTEPDPALEHLSSTCITIYV